VGGQGGRQREPQLLVVVDIMHISTSDNLVRTSLDLYTIDLKVAGVNITDTFLRMEG
jgi:hypothetical protein